MSAPLSSEPLPEVLEQLRRLASSDSESSRRAASDRLTQLLLHDFDTVLDATQEWALDEDPRIREVTLRACLQPPELTDDARVRHLLGRVERFIGDVDPTITELWTRSVVPHLLKVRPEVVLPWLRDWTKNPEEPVRAGVALTLGAISEKYPTDAVEGLAIIAVDPRPSVREAVLTSIEEMRARYPGMSGYLDARFGPLLAAE